MAGRFQSGTGASIEASPGSSGSSAFSALPESAKTLTQRRHIDGTVGPAMRGNKLVGEFSELIAGYLFTAIGDPSDGASAEPTTLGASSLAKISSRSPKPRIAP